MTINIQSSILVGLTYSNMSECVVQYFDETTIKESVMVSRKYLNELNDGSVDYYKTVIRTDDVVMIPKETLIMMTNFLHSHNVTVDDLVALDKL